MSHANFNVSLKLILVNNKKQILGLKVPITSYFAGFYDLPGGRIDVDELCHDFVKTLKREIKEEIGNLKINITEMPITAVKFIVPRKVRPDKKDLPVMYTFFIGKYLGGKIKLSWEHEGYEWLDVNEKNVNKYFYKNYLGGVEQYLKLKK